jgi:hypothetical protein
MNKKLNDEMERIIDILKTLKTIDTDSQNEWLDIYLNEFTQKQELYKELC